MINTYFIADTHFGHRNIIGFNRPEFNTLEEMHIEMIERWNAVVRPKDVVWHLGDVAFGKDNLHYLAQLNGEKKLVLGNHDYPNMELYKHYFKKIYGAAYYKDCILTHFPIHPNQFFRFRKNIHGHIHHKDEELMADKRYVNVCADHINLTPIHWDKIRV